MLEAYAKGFLPLRETRRYLVAQQETRLEKVQTAIPKDSPFYEFYASQPIDVARVLHVQAIAEGIAPPTFKDALNAYMLMIGDDGVSSGQFCRGTGIKRESNLVTHLKYDSGTNRLYDDQTRPCIDSKNFFRFGLKPEKNEDNIGWGRIPVLFYQRASGDLILPRAKEKSTEQERLLNRAIFFLSNERAENVAIQYVSASGRFLKRAILDSLRRNRDYKEEGFYLNQNKKMGVVWKKLDKLGVVPLFLVHPIPRPVLEKQQDAIRKYLRIK